MCVCVDLEVQWRHFSSCHTQIPFPFLVWDRLQNFHFFVATKRSAAIFGSHSIDSICTCIKHKSSSRKTVVLCVCVYIIYTYIYIHTLTIIYNTYIYIFCNQPYKIRSSICLLANSPCSTLQAKCLYPFKNHFIVFSIN